MNLGKETETLEFKKSTGEIKAGMVSIASIKLGNTKMMSIHKTLLTIVNSS